MSIYFFLLNTILAYQEIKPPGTIKIGDYYIDQTEVLNIHWIEYVHTKRQAIDQNKLYLLLPDSSNYWFFLPEKRHEPITHISYEQAVDYCQWRSHIVSENLGRQIIFRLPSPEEWDEIASLAMEAREKEEKRKLKSLKKQLLKKGLFYIPRATINPNEILDLFSNVSEMTATPGITRGNNNWSISRSEERTNEATSVSSGPYLGFRCIGEIVK